VKKAVVALCLLALTAGAGYSVYRYYVDIVNPDLGPPPPAPPTDGAPRQPIEMPQSPLVSHEKAATPNTNMRLVLSPRTAAEFIHALVPWDMLKSVDIPPNIEKLLDTKFAEVLPNEIALLSGADLGAKLYEFTFFVNQQYFDVLLPIGAGQVGLPRGIPLVKWDEEGLKLREPGMLTANGSLPVPEGLDAKLQELWPAAPAEAAPLTIQGGHLAELALDNRKGELLTLVAVAAAQDGQSLDDLFANPMLQSVPKVLAQLADVRAFADLGPSDALTVDFALRALDTAGPELEPVIAFAFDAALVQVKGMLQEYGLTLDGKAQWEGKTYHGAFTIPEFGQTIRDSVAALVPQGKRAEPSTPVTAPAEAPPATPAGSGA